MLALGRARGGLGFIKARALKPHGDDAITDSPCVFTNTHICTQVRQLCLDRATLPVTFFAEVHPGSLCTHTFPSALSLRLSIESIYDIQILPIS